MKTLLVLLIAMFFVTGISGQDVKKDTLTRKQARLIKKQKREAELKIQYDSISQIIDSRQFVLEADFLSNLRGRRIHVLSTLNFIKIDTTYSVIQIGSDRGIGYNGVGGVTAEGQITGWKLEKNDKHKSIYITLNVMTNIGIYDVFMDVSADGDAVATVSGLRAGRLEYYGKIVPLDESSVYKGHTP
jgi:hypothetical protein